MINYDKNVSGGKFAINKQNASDHYGNCKYIVKTVNK